MADAAYLLEECVELAGKSELAALRLDFARLMAGLLGAERLLLLGLAGEGDRLAPLASWPAGLACPGFSLFEAQRAEHPIMLALDTSNVRIEAPGELLMAQLRQLLFGDSARLRLVIVPAPVETGSFPDLIFLGLIPEGSGPDMEKLAGLFGRFCARHGQLATRLNKAVGASEILSRSLNLADRDRSQMRRSLPDALSGRLVGRSKPMQVLREQIAKFGPSELSVLIIGETGTGKELVARELHRLSARKDGPFVALNVAALPEGLAESELLGHVRGAFTGANRDRAGHIAAANGGTLFLDEIGDMPLALQAKLLRVLQEKRFRPVGSDVEQASDFRVVAATHRDLPRMIREERFRDDLYYRLGETRIALPPLREREGDIAVLAEHFLADIADRDGLPAKHLSSKAAEALGRYPFPGNVRELRALIHCAGIAACETIEPEHLWPDETPVLANDVISSRVSFRQACENFERRLLADSLKAAAGSRERMARELDLPLRTLFYKLKKYGIEGASEA